MDSPRPLRFGKRRGKVAEGIGCGRSANQLRPERGDQTNRRRKNHFTGHQLTGHQYCRAAQMIQSNLLADSHGRVMRDLRVSITDRCNFRCLYCLPETEAAANFYRERWPSGSGGGTQSIARQWTRRANLLTFEEIERAVRIAVELGIEKIRLTGGEP